MPFYATPFYGNGDFYGSVSSSAPGGPSGLTAYQNNLGTLVMYWGVTPCSTVLDDITWAVETDTVATFDSADLRRFEASESIVIDEDLTTNVIVFSSELITGNSYSVDIDGTTVGPTAFAVNSDTTMAAIATAIALEPNVATATVVSGGVLTDDDRRIVVTPETDPGAVAITSSAVTGGASQASTVTVGAVNTITGCIHKGMVVPSYERSQDEERVIYWRVLGIIGSAGSGFTQGTFNLIEDIDVRVEQAMLDLLPEEVFIKDDESSLRNIYDATANEINDLHLDAQLGNRDLFTEFVRDQSLVKNFASLVELTQPASMKTIDFREIVRVFLAVVGDSPTVASVKAVVVAMYCEEPTLTLIRDTLDMYVDDDSTSSDPSLPVEEFFVEDLSTLPVVAAPTVWDDQNLAFGTIINIENPTACTIPESFVRSVILKLTPAHAPIYITGI